MKDKTIVKATVGAILLVVPILADMVIAKIYNLEPYGITLAVGIMLGAHLTTATIVMYDKIDEIEKAKKQETHSEKYVQP